MRHIGLFLEELRTGATDAEFFRELIQTVDPRRNAAWTASGSARSTSCPAAPCCRRPS